MQRSVSQMNFILAIAASSSFPRKREAMLSDRSRLGLIRLASIESPIPEPQHGFPHARE
jgi:hypothetical protein